LVEDRDDSAGSKAIRLPGTRRGDLSSRAFKPEVRVSGLQFSPTGRDFAATSTEGLLIYSLDTKMFFDPFELELDITPASTRKVVKSGQDFGRALLMSLRLNEHDLIRETLEQIPVVEVDLVIYFFIHHLVASDQGRESILNHKLIIRFLFCSLVIS
jgi:periodic tryptophan protein 2